MSRAQPFERGRAPRSAAVLVIVALLGMAGASGAPVAAQDHPLVWADTRPAQAAVCDPPPAAGYSDLSGGSTLAEAVDWATCHRVVGAAAGTGGTAFASASATRRGTLLRALWVLTGRPAPDGPTRTFSDVPAGSRLWRAVAWATSRGVVQGDPEGTFRPGDAATRAALVTWSFRALSGGDVPPGATDLSVADVPTGTERHTAVAWAHAAGLVHLTADGRFRSNVTATRGATAKFLWRAAGTPAAWEQSFAGTALLATADGWWDVAAGDDAGGAVPDLTGGGNPLVPAPGATGDPVHLGRQGDQGTLFHPGWDDMILDTPDPASFPSGDFEFRIDADLTLELTTTGSQENVVFHQGGADHDASLAVSYDRESGAPTVWWSTDGSSWDSATGPPPSLGTGPGRRGVRFVADDGSGGHRVEFYEQPGSGPSEDLLAPFEASAWQPAGTVAGIGAVAIHDSEQEVAMSSGDDEVPAGNLATGWGRIRRMVLSSPEGTVFDLDPPNIDLPLSWTRSGPLPGAQDCWCMPDDTAGPAKDGSFTDASGATWTIHNWQTGSTPITVVDQPSILLGNGSRLTTTATDAFAPGPEGLSVVLGFRWTRSGISGAFLASQRPGTVNHDQPGWSMLVTGFLCCGPAFGVSDDTETSFARSPAERDGVATTAVGVFDRTAGTVRSFSGARSGDAAPAPVDAGRASVPQPFTIGADPDASLHSYGGFEFFGAAVFRRPLSPADVAAIDAQLTDPDRSVEVQVPAPIRFA